MGVPTGGPVDVKQVSTEELLEFLPPTKIEKPRGKDVKITRTWWAPKGPTFFIDRRRRT